MPCDASKNHNHPRQHLIQRLFPRSHCALDITQFIQPEQADAAGQEVHGTRRTPAALCRSWVANLLPFLICASVV
jgi:hypothetical protein